MIKSDTILYFYCSSLVECQAKSRVEDEIVCSNHGRDKSVHMAITQHKLRALVNKSESSLRTPH